MGSRRPSDRRARLPFLQAIVAVGLDPTDAGFDRLGHMEFLEREEFRREIRRLDERVDRMAEVVQADLDALAGELDTAATAIQGEITSLEAQIAAGTPVQDLDITGLKAAADAIAAIPAAVSGAGSTPSTPTEPVSTDPTVPVSTDPTDPLAPVTDPTEPVTTPVGGTTTDPSEPVTAPTGPTLYAYSGIATTVDPTVWISANVTEPDGTPLYTYVGDVNPGDATGAGLDSGEWTVYDGITVPATAVATPSATGTVADDLGAANPGIG